MKIFPLRLKILRNSLSQKDFAKTINVPQTSYSRYESGKNEPEYELLVAICRRYHVTADWLLGLTDNPSPNSGGLVQSAGAGAVLIGGANNGSAKGGNEREAGRDAPQRGSVQTLPPPTASLLQQATPPSCRDCPTVAALREAVNALREAVVKMGGK